MIVVDTMEMRCDVPDLVQRLGLETKVERLPVGDYRINDIIVERKAIGDLFGSKQSGHLDTQLSEMSTNYDVSYLIIEGDLFGYMMINNVPRSVFYSMYAGIGYKRSPDGKRGIIVPLLANTPYDTAALLKFLHDKVEKNEPRLPQLVKTSWGKKDRALYILSSFPNVGHKRAKKLLIKYGSLRDVLGSKSWLMKGLGPKTNKQCQELLDKRFKGVKKNDKHTH